MGVGLVLGGGAPNLPLMSGALLALDEAGVRFDAISTTGAGMLIGLLYAAPRKLDPEMSWEEARRAALRFTRSMGISDPIYSRFPVNYKIFNKTGPAAEAYARAVQPYLWGMPRKTKSQRLFGDMTAFGIQAASPSDLNALSKGLCQAPPWIETFVDFDDLRSDEGFTGQFVLAAYSLDDEMQVHFHRDEITAEHFKAGLAFPFIYEPYQVNGTRYLEGSAFDTLEFNPGGMMNGVDTIVYLDLMGQRRLVQEPRHLLDAWAQSIIDPLTSIAQKDVELASIRNELGRLRESQVEAEYEREVSMRFMADGPLMSADDAPIRYETFKSRFDAEEGAALRSRIKADVYGRAEETPFLDKGEAHQHFNLLRMPYRDHIPDDKWRTILDWSYSNMSELFDIGVATGESFVAAHRDLLEIEAP